MELLSFSNYLQISLFFNQERPVNMDLIYTMYIYSSIYYYPAYTMYVCKVSFTTSYIHNIG